MRLNQLLARLGVASRRRADELIVNGKVLVNGAPGELGTRVNVQADRVSVIEGSGRARTLDLEAVRNIPRVWIHHKDVGMLVSTEDSRGRSCVVPLVRQQLKLQHVISVGRLDFNSQGLLLFTDSGALAHALTDPANRVPRYYRVRVRGEVDAEKLAQLANGITVRGVRYGKIDAKLAAPQIGSNAWLSCTMWEGKNNELRNVLGHLGLTVTRLLRLGFGPYRLPKSLQRGETIEVKNLFYWFNKQMRAEDKM